MKLHSKYLILLSLVLSLVLGCDDDFDGDLATNPNQVSINELYSSAEGVNTAVIGAYSYLTTPRNLGVSSKGLYMHNRSDEMSSGSDYAVTGQLNARLTASFYTVQQPWSLMYTAAFAATDVIENADRADYEGDTALRDAYVGEAHMLRAFAHYFLLINWRNILILDEIPSDRSEYIRSQSDPMDVWNFIINDLTTAKGLLPNKDFWEGGYEGRMTAGAAAGLLGKVYLTMSGIEGVDMYNEAATEFAAIINGTYGPYGLTTDYIDNFDVEHENNVESVLEFQFFGDGDENDEFDPGFSFSGLFSDCRAFAPPGLRGGVSNDAVVHDWLYDMYATSIDNDGRTDRRMFGSLVFDDLLLPNGIPDLNDDGDFTNDRLSLNDGKTFEAVYFEDGTFGGKLSEAAPYIAANRKWMDWNLKIEGENTDQDDRFRQSRAHGVNWRFIRYADVLLMYAESVLMGAQEGAGTALAAVNQVRSRANMPLLGTLTMDALKTERILELANEGSRGVDLLRWGELASRMSFLEANDPLFKAFDNSARLPFEPGKNEYLPIPIDELDSNPTAVQNPGW